MAYDPAEQSAARRQLWQLFNEHPQLRQEVTLDDLIAQLPDIRGPYGRTDWTAMLRQLQALVLAETEGM